MKKNATLRQARPQPAQVHAVLAGLLLQRRLPAQTLAQTQTGVPGRGGRPGPARDAGAAGAGRAGEGQGQSEGRGGGRPVRDLPGQAGGSRGGETCVRKYAHAVSVFDVSS